MAEGRMLKKGISQSHEFAALQAVKAQLLYVLILPHLDIKGRMKADPRIIKGIVVPLLNFSCRKIWEYERDMHKVGLIKLYNSNGQWYLEATKFIDLQNLRLNHEADSQCPDPVTGQPPKPDESAPAQVQVKKVKFEYTEDFEKFWRTFKGRWNPDRSCYDKGSKFEAFTEWKKLSDREKQKATVAAAGTGAKFTPDGCRWLKTKRWEE